MVSRRIYTLGVAFALALALTPHASGTTTFTPPPGSISETDNGTDFPISASAAFTFGSGFFTVTLINLGGDTFYDSQNLGLVSFHLSNGGPDLTNGTGTVTDASTQVVNHGGASDIVQNVPVVPLTISVNWTLANIGAGGSFGAGNTSGGTNKVNIGANAYILHEGGAYNGTDAIIGTGNGSNAYTGTNPVGSCPSNDCNSGAPIAADYAGKKQATEQMIYGSATFTITNASVTSSTTVSNVFFGFGPDGPDQDDWVGSVQGSSSSVPEPASWVLSASGLGLIMGLGLWRKRSGISVR